MTGWQILIAILSALWVLNLYLDYRKGVRDGKDHSHRP